MGILKEIFKTRSETTPGVYADELLDEFQPENAEPEFLDKLFEKAAKPRPLFNDDFPDNSDPVDGDGDGFVRDGKPDEAPAPVKSQAKQTLSPQDDYAQNGIRSAAFKSWFGDWENDPANSSKVVDENGEPQEQSEFDGRKSIVTGSDGVPRVVYHGTSFGGFEEFKKDRLGTATAQNDAENLLYGPGFYFTEDESIAEEYRKINEQETYEFTTALDRSQLLDFGVDLERRFADEMEQWKKAGMEHDATHIRNALEDIKELNNRLQSTGGEIANISQDDLRMLYYRGEMIEGLSVPIDRLKTRSGEVKRVYLKIQKPFDMDGVGLQGKSAEEWMAAIDGYDQIFRKDDPKRADWRRELALHAKFIAKDADELKESSKTIWSQIEGAYGKKGANSILQSLGYDGITHIGGRVTGGKPHRVWITFEPAQIKAVENDGQFDPENPNMYKSFLDKLFEKAAKPRPLFNDDFPDNSDPVDGDGDGFVRDGKPDEAPAPKAKTKVDILTEFDARIAELNGEKKVPDDIMALLQERKDFLVDDAAKKFNKHNVEDPMFVAAGHRLNEFDDKMQAFVREIEANGIWSDNVHRMLTKQVNLRGDAVDKLLNTLHEKYILRNGIKVMRELQTMPKNTKTWQMDKHVYVLKQALKVRPEVDAATIWLQQAMNTAHESMHVNRGTTVELPYPDAGTLGQTFDTPQAALIWMQAQPEYETAKKYSKSMGGDVGEIFLGLLPSDIEYWHHLDDHLGNGQTGVNRAGRAIASMIERGSPDNWDFHKKEMETHKNAVFKALKNGEDVPLSVMSAYVFDSDFKPYAEIYEDKRRLKDKDDYRNSASVQRLKQIAKEAFELAEPKANELRLKMIAHGDKLVDTVKAMMPKIEAAEEYFNKVRDEHGEYNVKKDSIEPGSIPSGEYADMEAEADRLLDIRMKAYDAWISAKAEMSKLLDAQHSTPVLQPLLIPESERGTLEIAANEHMEAEELKSIDRAKQFLESYVDRSVLDLVKVKAEYLPDKVGRANCAGDTIRIEAKESIGTIVHEIGHAIEHADGGRLGKMATGFLNNEIASLKLEQLNKTKPEYGYAPHEIGNKDGFLDDYVGKVYESEESTEILSMGMQYMYSIPSDFLRKSPRHANWVIAVIKGMIKIPANL